LNPGGGEIFRIGPDRPWAPPSLLHNGYRVFPGGKEQPGRDADPSSLSSAVVIKEYTYTSTPPMGRTACTETQFLYKGALYLYLYPHYINIYVYIFDTTKNAKGKLNNTGGLLSKNDISKHDQPYGSRVSTLNFMTTLLPQILYINLILISTYFNHQNIEVTRGYITQHYLTHSALYVTIWTQSWMQLIR
jgi:hypothetical protein